MYVHALHTVHALPDLRVAGGRLGDVFYYTRWQWFERDVMRLIFVITLDW